MHRNYAVKASIIRIKGLGDKPIRIETFGCLMCLLVVVFDQRYGLNGSRRLIWSLFQQIWTNRIGLMQKSDSNFSFGCCCYKNPPLTSTTVRAIKSALLVIEGEFRSTARFSGGFGQMFCGRCRRWDGELSLWNRRNWQSKIHPSAYWSQAIDGFVAWWFKQIVF